MRMKIAGSMALFLVIASPLAFYIWYVVDKLLAGHVGLGSVLTSSILAFAFLVVASWFGHSIEKTMEVTH